MISMKRLRLFSYQLEGRVKYLGHRVLLEYSLAAKILPPIHPN